MRNISFMLTTQQVRDRSKTVTRRLNWLNLKVGDLLQGCEKCQGRKADEPLLKLAVVEVVSVRRERLADITVMDVQREGFFGKYIGEPDGVVMRPADFVTMFCASHHKCTPDTAINRIEFRYV